MDDKNIPVNIISQFQHVNDKLVMPRGNGRPTNALTEFFRRVKTKETTEAFLKLPYFEHHLGEVLQLFHEWLLSDCDGWIWERNLIDATARLMKAMEIITPFSHNAAGENIIGRHFVWLDREERMAAANELPFKDFIGKVKEYTGRASRKLKQEAEGPLDNPRATLHIYEYKKKIGNLELTYFYWQLKWDKSKIGDETDTLEKAAEAAYKCFYKNSTKLKFDKSLEPDYNKWIVLLGNWVTADDMKASKQNNMVVIPDVATDDRDGQMFVLNYPNPVKEKVKVLPRSIYKTSAAHKGSINPMDFKVELKSGTKIESSMDWYMYRPEDRVTGEVLCAHCNSIGDILSHMGAFVRGHGFRCGACINHLFEMEIIDQNAYDWTTE